MKTIKLQLLPQFTRRGEISSLRRVSEALHDLMCDVGWEEGGELRAEHSIIQVIRHQSRGQSQQPLL